ncbi:hypothetical protein PLICRDRAFT_106027 [Plicaturopsis crispa FD-325 SS-3]|nr:hypothetical protein PLICRDRAFT_106027 [Plicaturopsis crispa FD-325 SS-3]
MSADQFIFKKTGDNVYTRKCYGLETLASNMADGCDGFTHLVVTAGVSFEGSPSREIVQSQLRDAWITLRHQAPGLACRWFRHPAPDNHFGFSYTVPQSTADVDAWVKDTFFLTDEVKPLYETHRVLKDEHWWKSSDNHYVAELHASPLEKGWSIRSASVYICMRVQY